MSNYGKHVLILEDDLSSQMIIAKSLQAKGIEVLTASTIAEAKSLVDTRDIILFLLDVHLPDGDSSDLVKYIRSKTDFISHPILIITGDQEESRISEFFDLGVKDFINKPVHPLLMASRVQSFINSFEMEQALLESNAKHQKIALEKEQEEALGCYVYSHILETYTSNIDGLEVVTKSSGKFCGDILLAAQSPNGNLIVLLGDATGHGMAAALTIYPMASTFTAMVNKGLSVGAILRELTAKHNQCIPNNRFVAAILLEVSISDNSLRIWNGGMPAALVFHQDGSVTRLKSRNMALGILTADEIQTKVETLSLDTVTKIGVFSDGLIEDKEVAGRKISFDEAYSIIERNIASPKDTLELMYRYESGIQYKTDYDDLTLAVLDVATLKKSHQQVNDVPPALPGDFELSASFSGTALLNEEAAFKLSDLLASYSFGKEFTKKIFTVITELMVNALDHGILGIPSALKENDFVAYLTARMERQSQVSDQDNVALTLKWSLSKKALEIVIVDSGAGYEPQEFEQEDGKAYGRGLTLIRSLSSDFKYVPQTNTTNVVIDF